MSDYKEQIDKMCWSYSRLTSFGHCKYEFYLNYIINDDEQYLSEGNFFAESGSFVHEILAKVFSGEMTPDEAHQYFLDNFEDNICYKLKKKETMQKTFELCSDYFAALDLSWLDKYEILGVELKIKFKIAGYEFISFIDLLLKDKETGEIIVVDHKSAPYPFKQNGEVKKNSQHSFDTYKKQMYLYSFAVLQKFGQLPTELWWNHFKDGGKIAKIKFDPNEYDETVKWFADTIHEIEEETEYPPSTDYFYCHNLCNFRASCEYVSKGSWK